jgi:hypothetical protein
MRWGVKKKKRTWLSIKGGQYALKRKKKKKEKRREAQS